MGLGVPIYAAALARSYGKGEHASELTNDAPASPAAVRSTSSLTLHSTKRIQRRVFVYNRVGKAGSSSMLSLLTICASPGRAPSPSAMRRRSSLNGMP